MAIKEILGFDDFPEASRRPTIELLGKGLYPASNPGVSSANNSVMSYDDRKWLRVTGVTNPYLIMHPVANKIYTLEEVKTKKLWFGFRYVIDNDISGRSSSYYLCQLYFHGPNSSVNPILKTDMQRPTDEVYIEILIDIAGGKVDSYMDGTFVRSLSIADMNITNLTDIRIFYGQVSSAHPSENHLYNDFYWIADTKGEDAFPSDRLGPVKVKSVTIAGTVLPEDWTLSDPSSNADAILSPSTMSPTGERSPVVRTSPSESVASVGFAKPAAELSIKAVSIEVFGFRDTGTAPTLQAQLKQGLTLGEKLSFSVPTLEYNRGGNSDRMGCLNRDLDGKEWTNERIDSLEVLVNSKTGG